MKLRQATLILGLVSACGRAAPVPAPPAASAALPAEIAKRFHVAPELISRGRIALGTVEPGNEADEIVVPGQVIAPPQGRADIGALLPARVREVFVYEGATVRAGQRLAALDAPDAARLAGELSSATARRARAETILAQEEQLQKQNATSARLLSVASSDASAARAEELAARMLLGSYGVEGTRLIVKSPIAGVVVQSGAVLGTQVDSGTVLFRIVDPKLLAVRADVPESLAGSIALQSTARILSSMVQGGCAGQVVASTGSVELLRRSVAFRILPSPDCQGLLEGGFVDLRLQRRAPASSSDASSGPVPSAGDGAKPLARTPSSPAELGASQSSLVAVSRDAIVEIDGVPVAFVALDTPGDFRLTTLVVARHGEVTSYVEKGLREGERVVVRGALLLKGEWMRSRLE